MHLLTRQESNSDSKFNLRRKPLKHWHSKWSTVNSLSTLALQGGCTCSASISHRGTWQKLCFFDGVSTQHWRGPLNCDSVPCVRNPAALTRLNQNKRTGTYSTTLAKTIETGTQAKHRRVHARQITCLCHVRTVVSIFFGQGSSF